MWWLATKYPADRFSYTIDLWYHHLKIIQSQCHQGIGKTRYNYFSRNPRQWHFLQPLYPCSSVKWNSLSWLHSRHLFDSATTSFSTDSTSRLRSNLSYFSQILGFLQRIWFYNLHKYKAFQYRNCNRVTITIDIETQEDHVFCRPIIFW